MISPDANNEITFRRDRADKTTEDREWAMQRIDEALVNLINPSGVTLLKRSMICARRSLPVCIQSSRRCECTSWPYRGCGYREKAHPPGHWTGDVQGRHEWTAKHESRFLGNFRDFSGEARAHQPSPRGHAMAEALVHETKPPPQPAGSSSVPPRP